MLALEVGLLTGRYIATSFDDRSRPEWPPHPARVFSALVATHFEALEPAADEAEVLRWLEAQGAPQIEASEASERDVVTVFVPVNDTQVVSSLDDPAALLEEAEAELLAAEAKGGKAVASAKKKRDKADASFRDRVAKTIARLPEAKIGKGAPAEAAQMLPEQRGKQARTFPSVSPRTPVVRFSWPEARASEAQREVLDALAARVVRIGHSSSLVSCRFLDTERGAPTWIPSSSGEGAGSASTVLRVVGPGQLEMLSSTFEQHPETPGRVMPATFQRYVRPGGQAAPELPSSTFGDDWIVFRHLRGRDEPAPWATRTVEVARTLRRALLASHGPDAPQILSGHAPSGETSGRPHAAFVPLPYVGSRYAEGSILGAALVIPREASDAERLALYRAVNRWEEASRKGDEECPIVKLFFGHAGEMRLERVEGSASLSTLRPETWSAPATRWASATPVALDRNPGDLGSSDPAKEAAAFATAEATVAAACAHIGLPTPSRVVVLPAAPLVGAPKARRYPVFKSGANQRVLVHVQLELPTPVAGPILLGAGRYFGLGLMRPLRWNDE